MTYKVLLILCTFSSSTLPFLVLIVIKFCYMFGHTQLYMLLKVNLLLDLLNVLLLLLILKGYKIINTNITLISLPSC